MGFDTGQNADLVPERDQRRDMALAGPGLAPVPRVEIVGNESDAHALILPHRPAGPRRSARQRGSSSAGKRGPRRVAVTIPPPRAVP